MENKLNMTLDQLVKQRTKTTKKPKVVGKKKVIIKKTKKAGKSQSNAMDIDTTTTKKATKIAKSVGVAKAKRSAQISQKRGLNTTGKATAKEIKSSISKEVAKTKKTKAGAAGVSSMKISFNTADLNKTTDKAVADQIRVVLAASKAKGTKKESTPLPAVPQSRQVLLPVKPRIKK